MSGEERHSAGGNTLLLRVQALGQALLFYRGSLKYFCDVVFDYPTFAEAYRVQSVGAMEAFRSPQDLAFYPIPGIRRY